MSAPAQLIRTERWTRPAAVDGAELVAHINVCAGLEAPGTEGAEVVAMSYTLVRQLLQAAGWHQGVDQ